MKPSLAELQSRMQASILTRDGSTLPLMRRPPNDTPKTMFGVYENAYALRLVEFLHNDHERLSEYLGDAKFSAMGRAYARAHPSDTPNARWFSRHLPEFLSRAEPWSRHPELAELAQLEQALNTAFDAMEAPHVGMADLAQLDPEAFDKTILRIHPSAIRLSFATNVTGIWSSLKAEQAPPKPETLAEAMQILVWRQGSSSRFRILGTEEAMAFDEAANGVPFGVLCEMIALMDDPDTAAMRAATYLRGWIDAELISAVSS